MSSAPVKSAIVGVAGTALSDAERTLYREQTPFGFILFKRNCVSPDQLRLLVHEICQITGRADTPILIDQEGGRVARLRQPVWAEYPAPDTYGRAYDESAVRGQQLAAAGGHLMGEQLRTIGVNVNCAPMLDVPSDDAHTGVIGDRAFAQDPHTISVLGRAYAEGLRSAGILPVIKHMPGHGRATADSHTELPVVKASRVQLAQSDFAAFKALNDMPLGMTAHVLYSDLDPDYAATMSVKIIRDIIRGEIGFNGLLMADDLSMEALKGSFGERTEQCLAAGNDIALCGAGAYKGDYVQIAAEVLTAATPLSDYTRERWAKAQEWLKLTPRVDIPQMTYTELIAALAPHIRGNSFNSGDSLVASV
ncbi:MAG: beta-N-acetylhexosaminidase [Bdellovibrionales bacterium]